MLEPLFKDLQQIKAIRKEAIEFSGMKFRGQGLKFIDGKPIWIQNGKPYYIFLLMKLSGRFMQHPAILNEISNIIARIVDFSKVDKILTLETMGIHISTALSLRTKKPLAIAGKIKYYDEVTLWEPPHQIEVTKKTGYGVSKLYINDIFPEDKIMIFDSIISTGGSFSSLIKKLKEKQIKIVDAVAVLEKVDYGGVERVKKETGIDVKTLIRIKIRDVREHNDHLEVTADVYPTKYLTKCYSSHNC
ncbi:MAG: hypothetical protein J7L07_07280 [Candidatus Odinarchaeota archaeon]|nr:hypothetical protein [Candidatus Odinarchaeota archaeon]